MPQRTRRAGVPRDPVSARAGGRCAQNDARTRAGRDRGRAPGAVRGGTAPGSNGASAGRRVLAVLVLTPVLIFYMSRKDVGHAASKVVEARAVERWPGFGFESIDRAGRERALFARYRQEYESDPRGANRIYARAMFLARRYDSRPYWREGKLGAGMATDRATADLAIEHLIPCESMGRTINRIDSNGKMSYGILQFQDWDEWEAMSGLSGNPDNRADAIRMAEWAIQNGMINHWTCAGILKIQ